MNRNALSSFKPPGLPVIIVAIVFSLVFSILACSVNLPGIAPSQDSTVIARRVESTLNAEKVATFEAQQTETAAQPVSKMPQDSDTSATIQAQQATLDAQSTSLAPQATQPIAIAASPTATAAASRASLDPIQIQDWTMAFWMSLPNGCDGLAPCWTTNDDYNKHKGSSLILTSKNSYVIDLSWPNPYLVFRDKRDNQDTSTVEAIIDGTPNLLMQYPKGEKYWSNESIDLSAHKGKEIVIRFVAPGKSMPGGGGNWGVSVPPTRWFVAKVQIVPNFQP